MDNKWIKRYFDIAKDVASWSKDPSKKIGAVIIGDKRQVLSQGYNGFPRGIDDSEYRYNNRELKYKYVVHAEANAIYNALYSGVSVDGATMFVTGLPCCRECAKAIIQAGIKEVYYDTPIDLESHWSDSLIDARDMLFETRVPYILVSEEEQRGDIHSCSNCEYLDMSAMLTSEPPMYRCKNRLKGGYVSSKEIHDETDCYLWEYIK